MAYNKTNWVDGMTPLSAANLNKMETGIEAATPIRGAFADTTTSIAGSSFYTKTIPLGRAAISGWLMLVSGGYGSLIWLGNATPDAKAISRYTDGAADRAGYFSDGSSYIAYAADGSQLGPRISVYDAVITGTDLVIRFRNWDSTAKTLNVKARWEVI
ncbi:MAG: hypothetical protein ACM3XN_02520 [Chloroflexota bacterium]